MQPQDTTTELKYLVRSTDGKEYGPATLEDLTSWIQQGRVNPHHEVQRSDMQHWAQAGTFSELGPLFPASTTATQQAQTPTASTPDATGQPGAYLQAAVARMRSGGSWFFWIAGLSLVNTVAALSGREWRFIVGLGITQVFDDFASEAAATGKIIAVVLDFIVAGMFVGFGVFANKAHGWAFIIGMVLFALDGLLMLLVRDWIGVGFHAFVLFCLFRGYSACREVKQLARGQ